MPYERGPWGVMLSHNEEVAASMGEEAPVACRTPMICGGLGDTKKWSKLPFSSHLRVPLIAMPFTGPMFVMDKYLNDTAFILSIECDQSSDYFGETTMEPFADVFFVRAAGYDLDPQHIEAMVAYIGRTLPDLVCYGKLDGDEDQRLKEKAIAALEKVTPKSFEEFFEEYRAGKIAEKKKDDNKTGEDEKDEAKKDGDKKDGDKTDDDKKDDDKEGDDEKDDGEKEGDDKKVDNKDWEKVKSPFAVGPPICKGCGKYGNVEAPLSKCSSCKRVAYCSKDCQKKDWKLHKMVFH